MLIYEANMGKLTILPSNSLMLSLSSTRSKPLVLVNMSFGTFGTTFTCSTGFVIVEAFDGECVLIVVVLLLIE